MKHIALIVIAASLSGCGTLSAALEGKMQNRVTTTLDCKRGFFASLYGPIGITSEIDPADVAYLPCHLKK